MPLRTKARFGGTAREGSPGASPVRPLELFFFALAGAASAGFWPTEGCSKAGPAAGDPPAASEAAAVASPPPTPTPAPDFFATAVRPVLLAKCSPCHEPGGKMYARLPFDDASVVSGHSAGVLKRLQGDDRAAVEKWLATLPTPGS